MSNPRAFLVFVAVAFLWGVPFAFIAVALDDGASPLFIAWARVFLGAVVLGVIAHRRGHLAGIRRHLGVVALIAACDIALPFALLPLAQQHLSSSLAGILIATTPLFVAMIAMMTRTEAHNARGWIGLALGLAGVAAIVGVELSGDLLAGLLMLAAALSYAVATVLVRNLHDVSALGGSAAALMVAAVLLAPVAFLGLELPAHASGWAALVLLGLLCTAAAVALFYQLVAGVGATTAALSLYLAPVFSVIVGAVFLAEQIGPTTVIGFLLILAGSRLTRRNVVNRTPSAS